MNYEHLRKLAEAVPQVPMIPVNTHITRFTRTPASTYGFEIQATEPYEYGIGDDPEARPVRDYIIAASPSVILAILAELDALRAELEQKKKYILLLRGD